MANDAETTARNAEKSTTNDPGYCLQWSRERAAIGSYYPDAATAWANTNDRHPGDRKPPRGSMAFWTGGSRGYGHIAPSVGGGDVRSTDAGGSGHVATVDVGWPERAWGLHYAGWAWDVNEVTIPHSQTGADDMPTYLRAVAENEEIGNWTFLRWASAPTDPDGLVSVGNFGLNLAGRLATCNLLGRISGLADGVVFRTRHVAGNFNTPDGKWQTTSTGRAIDHISHGADVGFVDERILRVSSSERIRYQVQADAAAVLESASLSVTYW